MESEPFTSISFWRRASSLQLGAAVALLDIPWVGKISLALLFILFACCFRCKAISFLAFLSVFPFFPRDFRGSAQGETPCLFVWVFPCFFRKSKEKKIRGLRPGVSKESESPVLDSFETPNKRLVSASSGAPARRALAATPVRSSPKSTPKSDFVTKKVTFESLFRQNLVI